MFITKKHLSRRHLLRAAGTSIALPFLDAMVPAATALAQTAARPVRRLGFVYIPMGANAAQWVPGVVTSLEPAVLELDDGTEIRTTVKMLQNGLAEWLIGQA